MTNTIYALKGAEDRSTETLSSLKRGEGRFGWSYIENADLRKLRDKIEKHGWDNLTEDEQSCYQSFLLEFKPGDYAIYISMYPIGGTVLPPKLAASTIGVTTTTTSTIGFLSIPLVFESLIGMTN